jgi:glycerophosphoryl diester phosphodiesterase
MAADPPDHGDSRPDEPPFPEDIVVVDRRTIEFLRSRGLAVFAWTVDDEPDMRQLIADGVDGIMTDRPDLLARVLGRA